MNVLANIQGYEDMGPVLQITKYPNNKMYLVGAKGMTLRNGKKSPAYLNLSQIEAFIKGGREVQVTCWETGDDLTSQVLGSHLSKRYYQSLVELSPEELTSRVRGLS